MTRQEFIKTASLGTASIIAAPSGFAQTGQTMKSKHTYNNAFGMARSLTEEYTYETKIEGKIPTELNGTLYRNGPGLFERNGYRKENILDGDGMVQAFQIREGKVKYRNRFVRTKKWLEEEIAGKYKYNTWTTRRPGGAFRNAFLQGKFDSQAGVTVRVINDRLFAFDESGLPYELNPETLETIKGDVDFGVQFENVTTLFAAHNKIDGRTGEWIQFGLANGPKSTIQLSIFKANMELARKKLFKLPMGTYMHDFFVSENYIIFNLQPAEMELMGFITGFDSFAESLKWRNKKGSTFMVIHKSLEKKPLYLKTDAVWMWHSLNAFEKGGEIFCYFCGYDEPDHFIGNHAQTYEIMKKGATPQNIRQAENPGSLRLVRIDPRTSKISMSTLNTNLDSSYEFPIMNEKYSSYEHDLGYFARGNMNGALHHQISRINIQSGVEDYYDFGEGQYCGEPIFVTKKCNPYGQESGWLMTLVFDEKTDKSFVSILDTDSISDGPVANIHLDHHSPMSFHGTWHEG